MNIQSMKTMFLTIALSMGSIFCFANDGELSNISVNPAYGRKLVVDMRDMHFKATIRLETEGGRELINMDAEAPAFAKMFDLSDLKSGLYRLVIEYGIRELNQDLMVDETNSYIKLTEREVFMKPMIRQFQKDYVDLTMMNKRIATVYVEIVNSNGRTVFEEEIKNVLKVEKRYDLGQLSRDTYAVVVKTPHKTYTDFVKNW